MIPYTQEQSSLLPPCHDLAPRLNSDPNTIPPISILQDMPNSEDSLDEADIQAIYPPYPLVHRAPIKPAILPIELAILIPLPLLLLQPLSVAQATQIEGEDGYNWEVEGGLTTEKRKLDN
ncbi:hypothetical protein SERLA73DRAFT_69944 [Serpula lacrymans var. lacrymans S7.3]|uniref:Uncharacterized protein n=2 Tax=Serpula lacrymans var. lacrymans TaxID=341189 RepID=F8PLF7_SERL3|nr:uncharacterized protein SERLADRAFT_434023 [Serpula lacrymans var. lacrymans S7.9]EGO02439.1 hypothetical protein SERLA73DRAFT_69944 [Serpula lacrymans var. lacrymans S7.3]EGO28169.1 hypothetical protein SERLADRAFT_434023 [Serpula lacrymans var. lacrymans S7.9]